ncbi:MAG: hypothetical protein LBD04_07525, partial [Synergistaceae bacterium]|nr:hypothetical protein [Synergistaceae bacterium]
MSARFDVKVRRVTTGNHAVRHPVAVLPSQSADEGCVFPYLNAVEHNVLHCAACTDNPKQTVISTALGENIESNSGSGNGGVRKKGGGPKWLEEKYPDIQKHVMEIIDGSAYGNPEKVLSWTTESLRSIQKTLAEKHNIKASHVTIGNILENLDYSKQANQKMLQVGEPHPDRNEQFEFINNKAKEFVETYEPVISVDTNKKENIGNFRNS